MFETMTSLKGLAVWTLCAVMCASQPVDHLPVLKEAPDSVTFKVSDKPSPLILSCVVENAKNIKYIWKKDGDIFEWKSRSDIAQKPDEGTIIIQKPRDEDAGQYQCFAESNFGVATTGVIKVEKLFIDTPKVIPLKHKPVKGKPFKLDCAVPNAYPEPEVQWVLQSANDPSNSKVIIEIEYHITQSPDGNLWFANVTEKDVHTDMKYVCQALTPAADGPVVLAEHYIEDLVENKEENTGELVAQYLSKDMTVQVGKVTMIYCIYGGTPLAYPGWRKNGQTIKDEPQDRVTKYNGTGGKRLLIKDTWLVDEGNYTCFADNEVDKVKEHTVHLTVVSAPVFSKRPQMKITAKQGEEVTINCQILGVPAPEATWTYNAKPLPRTDRISVKQSSVGNSTVADLTINNLEGNDAGYYGCKGYNGNGKVYAETLLYVS
ncbi:unnamed protein product [Parnassius apollo]|uniref:Hemolin n=1 Tax=Parnassius apollo TaxID=110799 RepID=A0A8S3YEH0_PARAO|nr:unnamed protein product [Parnassius apollo]